MHTNLARRWTDIINDLNINPNYLNIKVAEHGLRLLIVPVNQRCTGRTFAIWIVEVGSASMWLSYVLYPGIILYHRTFST
jgi:hypothetical protein